MRDNFCEISHLAGYLPVRNAAESNSPGVGHEGFPRGFHERLISVGSQPCFARGKLLMRQDWLIAADPSLVP